MRLIDSPSIGFDDINSGLHSCLLNIRRDNFGSDQVENTQFKVTQLMERNQ